MKRVVRWLGWGLLIVVLILSFAGAAGYWWLRQALPEVAGEITVEGLTAPVEIVRDRHGVPHIVGEADTDAIFAQGFAHAQDRLWQMEFQRRVGAGRLAEIVGAPGLPTDRFMRVLGLYRLAEASLAHLSDDSLAWLDAYAAGVNAFLATRSGPLPPEFLLLGHAEIEPWRPADSVVWIKMMALDLSLNWRSELLRARLAKRLSDEQIGDLWPTYPDDAPVTLTALARDLDLEQLAGVLPPAPPPGLGSNAWVVDGEHSRTGAPLLANDPHLGLRAPGAWYLAHLKSPDLELIGAGLPGVPGIVLGHNGSIAWGMTNTGPDSQDLFIERVDPVDSARYLTPEGSAPFEVREEIIRVKDAASVTFNVRKTRHGPVLSDVLTGTDQVLAEDQLLALAWTALIEDDTSIESLFDLTKATDWQGFLDAVEGHDVPQQNVFYADRTGHIGFIAPGRVPVRKRGDGLWPVPGWTGEYDWIGTVPWVDLPRDQDPASGRFLNGNNRVVPADYPHLITAIWEPPYRARRIDAMLGGRQHDLGTFAEMQLDQLSLLAVDFLPSLLETTPSGEPAKSVVDDLRRWDRVMRAEAPEPLIFAAWYRELGRLIYADELGPLFPAYWNIRPQFMERVLTGKKAWCDDLSTEGNETCQDVAAKALDLALGDLRRRFGDDRSAWRWGTAHPVRMAHAVVDGQPVLQDIFNIRHPSGGDSVTINVGHYALVDDEKPFTSVQGASYRGLYDLSDLDRSRFIAATGQSGHPLSSHYRDLSALWAAGETISMDRDPNSYAKEVEGRLRLTPASHLQQATQDAGTQRD
jgi:penicillin amidase